ncbi:MAG: efflux RND transporter periplasmic adaptor subunit [Caulobacteraceae bacterium]|nr:efflux RND transporter periplasmic adaptor subunit [Caulobacteraceae bacterium]
MKTYLTNALRIAVTLAFVAAAVFAGSKLWRRYQVEPWTRDGRVRADVVQIAPDVSGLVTDVAVADNQPVKRGQVLFHVDRARYAIALRQAQAAVAAQGAALDQARREAARNRALGDLIAQETAEQSRARVEQAAAALAQAETSRDLAALNLQRTVVVAPMDGYLSDLPLRAGDYVTAGKPVMALVDVASFHVEGYFEETKLKGVAIGQQVSIRIMGDGRPLRGHVQSISAGIEDRERTSGANLLPNVNPTFSWVRLAQRVPVRIALDETPNDLRMIAGRTATVAIVGGPGDGRRAAEAAQAGGIGR